MGLRSLASRYSSCVAESPRGLRVAVALADQQHHEIRVADGCETGLLRCARRRWKVFGPDNLVPQRLDRLRDSRPVRLVTADQRANEDLHVHILT